MRRSSLVLALLTALAPLVPSVRAAVSENRDALRELGFANLVQDDEVYDPWMGFKMKTSLQPDIHNEAEAMALVKTMRKDSDPCARQAARLIERDGIGIRFVSMEDPASKNHAAEGGYSNNTIYINGDHPYMRNSENLKKRIVHESFHHVQEINGWINGPSDYHRYADRVRIIDYLRKQFPEEGQCRLPEVPEGLRNSVENTVHIKRVPSLDSLSAAQGVFDPQGGAAGAAAVVSPPANVESPPKPPTHSRTTIEGRLGRIDVATTVEYWGNGHSEKSDTIYLQGSQPMRAWSWENQAGPWTGEAPNKRAVAGITWDNMKIGYIQVGDTLQESFQRYDVRTWPNAKVVAIDVDYSDGYIYVKMDQRDLAYIFDLRTGNRLR